MHEQATFEERVWSCLGGRDGVLGRGGRSVPDVAKLIESYYREEPTGGFRFSGACFDRVPTDCPNHFVPQDRRALRWLSLRPSREGFNALIVDLEAKGALICIPS